MSEWTGRLLGLALLLQSFELLKIKPYPWAIVRREIPRALQPLLLFYQTAIYMQLMAALFILLVPNPLLALPLLVTQWMIAVRWRGTFNGASDVMTFLITAAWVLSAFIPAALWYVVIQLLLSYFVAGLAKLLQKEWRSGMALAKFLHRPQSALDLPVAWGVMVFEIFFPLSLLSPRLALAFMVVGTVFHLANAYVFGLNRFVFAWLAAYPALYWATLRVCESFPSSPFVF